MMDYSVTIKWLLEDNHPMAKYNTLKELLDRSDKDPEVVETLAKMMNSRPVATILKWQNEEGGFFQESWYKRAKTTSLRNLIAWGYIPKYKAPIWQTRFLAEAGVPGSDGRIQRLGEWVLKNVYEEGKGFFDDMLACVNGDMVWALCKFGFGQRSEVKEAFNLHVEFQKYENGDWIPPTEWPYNGKQGHCFGPCSCYNGITQLLRAMTVVPKSYWTKKAQEAKNSAIKFLINHGVIQRRWKQAFAKNTPSYVKHRTKPLLQLTAPIGAQSDPVEVTTNLLMLGVNPIDVSEAIQFILSKRTKNDKWILENTRSNMYSSWGKKGQENKWITFKVLRMLMLANMLR